MKFWQKVILVGFLLLIVYALFSFLPEAKTMRLTLEKFLQGAFSLILVILQIVINVIRLCVLAIILIFGTYILGIFARVAVEAMDNRLQREEDIGAITHICIAILVGLILLVVQPKITMLSVHDEPVVKAVLSIVGLGGPYETTPLFFMIWGFIAGVLGYATPSALAD